tara:strand:+ start:377 stop:514 length:138 start_codon:yes stop_codon:yes gene_type:complete
MIVYIVLTIMGIFTIWSIIYTDRVKKERHKIINNIKKYEQKKREK